MINIRLETERLLLRPFQMGDEAAVLEFSSNREVNRYTGDPIIDTLTETVALIENVWLSDYSKYGYGRFAVIHKIDEKIIGFCGVKYLPELEGTDLGYRFLPAYWGKGIATEACQVMVNDAFQRLQLEKIHAFVEPDNNASTKVLEKVGFQFDKKAPYPKETNPVLWYSLLKTDYERQ